MALSTSWPMRVMIFMLTMTYGESVTWMPYLENLEPNGPMQKGMMYIVRPFMQPRNNSRSFCFISSGSAQLLVGPASSLVLEQMNVQLSTRATSLGSDRHRKLLGRFCWFRRMNVPAFTSWSHMMLYSSSEPDAQCSLAGLQSFCMRSTKSMMVRLCVGASLDFIKRASSCVRLRLSGSGRRLPNWSKCSLMDGISASHSSGSTCSRLCMTSGVMSRPEMSMASDVGTNPMGVVRALPAPSTRSQIHFSTREFSPKPGHRNLPPSLRNQLT
mmetsp:Transcript_25304/g.63441  ORF Transcript_25304/g.63441 Transcript_25304/m.63441 type:complete len:271 (+) Transcript_25304:529-1341(+)